MRTFYVIASQSVGEDWTAEQALAFIKEQARKAIAKCRGPKAAHVSRNPPKFDFDQFGSIEKTLDISTAHILKGDVDLLEQGHGPLVAYSYAEGFFLSTYSSGSGPQELRDHGFSDGFIDIVQSARSANIRWVNLDGAGVTYSELPEFEWDVPEVAVGVPSALEQEVPQVAQAEGQDYTHLPGGGGFALDRPENLKELQEATHARFQVALAKYPDAGIEDFAYSQEGLQAAKYVQEGRLIAYARPGDNEGYIVQILASPMYFGDGNPVPIAHSKCWTREGALALLHEVSELMVRW